MLKNAFLYRIALHELKKQPFSASQKVFVYRKLYALPSKASRFCNQNTAHSNNFLLSSKAAFFTYKKPFFCTSLSLQISKTAHSHKPKALLLHKTFLNCHPKQLFFALRCPFQPPLTYCPPKNTAILLIFALTPYAVKPEPRTDSNHCRRCPAKLQLFAKPVTG